jgi:hypothetical protein
LLGGIGLAIAIIVVISKNNQYPVQAESAKTTQTEQLPQTTENQVTHPPVPTQNVNTKTAESTRPKDQGPPRESPEVALQKRIISEIRSGMVRGRRWQLYDGLHTLSRDKTVNGR